MFLRLYFLSPLYFLSHLARVLFDDELYFYAQNNNIFDLGDLRQN